MINQCCRCCSVLCCFAYCCLAPLTNQNDPRSSLPCKKEMEEIVKNKRTKKSTVPTTRETIDNRLSTRSNVVPVFRRFCFVGASVPFYPHRLPLSSLSRQPNNARIDVPHHKVEQTPALPQRISRFAGWRFEKQLTRVKDRSSRSVLHDSRDI